MMPPSANADHAASAAPRPLRLAFGSMCMQSWIAGCHYLKNLFIALRSLEQPVEIVLVYWAPPVDESHQMLAPYVDEEIRYTGLARSLPVRAANYLSRRFELDLGVPVPTEILLRRNRLDALLMVNHLGKLFSFPLMVWIPDFQHVYLPEMFTPAEIDRRNQEIVEIGQFADRVILSSHSARADFEKFVPGQGDKARVLSFVSQVNAAEVYAHDPAWVCEQYHLPERYFYLPNQFWKHKNHTVVVEALAHLRQRFPQIAVVCSGNTHDYRTPSYFPQMLAAVSRAGVRENFIILGMVPHEHIFPLMRQSLAVLQPSLFEGWSTTVEEVKSLGKQIILSDIPTHREQNPPQARYFDPHDPRALAEVLVQAFDEAQPGPDMALEAAAQEALPARTRTFGQTYLDITRELLAGG